MNTKYIIENVHLYQEGEFTPCGSYSLVINGDKIEAICPNEESLSSELPKIDGKASYVIPGMIDCHNHVSLDVKLENYLERMNHAEMELAMIAFRTLREDLHSGVTTSRCMGERHFLDVFCRKAIKEGMLEGPDLKVSGIGLRASHGHGYIGMPFDGVQALIQAVRNNVHQGVDWIKYYSTASAPMADGKTIVSFYTEQEIAAIIEEAHRSNKKVTTHCIGGEALQVSLRNGVDCIEHVYFADEKDINTLLEYNTTVCLTPTEYFVDNENAPAGYRSTMVPHRSRVEESMRMVIENQIPFVLGTDGSHGKLWLEASLVSGFGAGAREIIDALTIRAAKLLGIDSHTGMIKSGYDADLVLLSDNPLNNIENLKEIQAVYKKGKLVG